MLHRIGELTAAWVEGRTLGIQRRALVLGAYEQFPVLRRAYEAGWRHGLDSAPVLHQMSLRL